MEKKLYQSLLLAIAKEGITLEDAKEMLYTLLPALFTGVCTHYRIDEKDEAYADALLYLKMAADRALDYFADYEPEDSEDDNPKFCTYKIMVANEDGSDEFDGVIYQTEYAAKKRMHEALAGEFFGLDLYVKEV